MQYRSLIRAWFDGCDLRQWRTLTACMHVVHACLGKTLHFIAACGNGPAMILWLPVCWLLAYWIYQVSAAMTHMPYLIFTL